MATAAYRKWVNAGRPQKTAVPVAALTTVLRRHGYTVYLIGNDAHLQSAYPEDHAPFSTTGWPGRHPYPYINAMDVMPPTPGQRSKLDGKPLPSLQQLGARLFADKTAGVAGVKWLKYMNWEPQGNYCGPCWHDAWQPTHSRRASGDRGHIHLSGRTDFVQSHTADDYDPVARIRAAGSTGGDDMALGDKVYDRTEPDGKTKTARTVGNILGTLDVHSLRAEVDRVAEEAWRRVTDAKLALILARLGDASDVEAKLDALAAAEQARAEAERARDEAHKTEVLAAIHHGGGGSTRPEPGTT